MSSDEVKFAEAVASLTARLNSWGIEGAAEKAEVFMRDMIHHGWRARGLATVHHLEPPGGTPPPDLGDVRAKLKADTEAYQAHIRKLREERKS